MDEGVTETKKAVDEEGKPEAAAAEPVKTEEPAEAPEEPKKEEVRWHGSFACKLMLTLRVKIKCDGI